MKPNSSALILLSTFNGEKYIEEQLESIISQTFTNWTLLIRDDGSSDATMAILHKYSHADARIKLLDDNQGNLGIQKSFSALMQQACDRSENYIFFSDQDDVWLPSKLALQVSQLEMLEEKHGNTTPLLVHTDLCVVDRDLNVIHPSYIGYEKLVRNTSFPLKTLLVNNYVTGCTIGMNKALLHIASPVPDNAYMHDWWCALCAAATGKIGFLDEAMILYRQHNQNSIGSSGFYGKFRELKSFNLAIKKRKKNLGLCFGQAASLLKRVSEKNQHYQLIDTFCKLTNLYYAKRYLTAAKLRLQPAGMMRGILFWVFLGLV